MTEAKDFTLPPFWTLNHLLGEGARGGWDDRDWFMLPCPTGVALVLLEGVPVSTPEGGELLRCPYLVMFSMVIPVAA